MSTPTDTPFPDLLKEFQSKIKKTKRGDRSRQSEDATPLVKLDNVVSSQNSIYFAYWSHGVGFIPFRFHLEQNQEDDQAQEHQNRTNAPPFIVKTREYNTKCDVIPLSLADFLDLKDICLPDDRLPIEFLQDIAQKQLGNIIIAYHLNDDQYTVVGGICGVHMTFWSRFANTEFKLRRILNLFSIFVSPMMRGTGLGGILFDTLVYSTQPQKEEHDHSTSCTFQFDEISLEVRATNQPAIKLYARKGLTQQNMEDDYYEIGKTKKDRRMHEMVVSSSKYQYSSIFALGTCHQKES